MLELLQFTLTQIIFDTLSELGSFKLSCNYSVDVFTEGMQSRQHDD